MAFIHDHSGKLFKGKKVTLRDVVANGDATELYLGCVAPPCAATKICFSLGDFRNDKSD